MSAPLFITASKMNSELENNVGKKNGKRTRKRGKKIGTSKKKKPRETEGKREENNQ